MSQRSGRTPRHVAVVIGLVAGLCLSTTLAATPALAVTTDELQAKVDAASQSYQQATDRVNELKGQIEESQRKIDEVEAKLPEQQAKASEAARSMYKMQQDSPGIISLLLSSESFQDFITTYQYINAIQTDNLDQTTQLADLKDELVSAQQTLKSSQAEAEHQQEASQQALDDAQKALDELNRQILEQKAAEEAARAAEEAARQAAAQQQANAATANAQTQQQTQQQTTQAVTPQPNNPDATDGSEVETDGEWMFGSASAYDVSSNTGFDQTASGETLTDTSMTVAVPASQRYLLGRSVQIRYNGVTVTARVTDTGGFAQYGRVLDLAGGVWKAFGFSSTSDWGVRMVQYRFL